MRAAWVFLFSACVHAATPTFGSITATPSSPNSATVAVTITGAVSIQIQASTDNSFSIKTPWFPVGVSNIAAQLQPSTLYNFRVVACDVSVTALPVSNACSGNLGTSGTATATTNTPIATYPISVGLGATTSYNTVGAGVTYTDMDTPAYAWLQNGTIILSGNDGKGNQNGGGTYILNGGTYTGGRDEYLQTMDAAMTTIALLNPMGTGDGSNGWGQEGASNVPNCYSDNSTLKSSSIFGDGTTLYLIGYRQNGGFTTQGDNFINRSDDGGATWYNPSQSAGSATANGNPACPGAGVMWTGNSKIGVVRFVQYGQGGVVSNPVGGIDAYWYAQVRSANNTLLYLIRCFKKLNIQVVGNWEGYTGARGGDQDLQANWNTDLTLLASIADQGGSVGQDWEIQYLPDFGRFIAGSEIVLSANDYRMQVWDAPFLTGTWEKRYQEPTRPPFNSADGTYLNRAWLNPFMPSYTTLSLNPPSATLNFLHSGTFDFNQFRADPANNWYSPQMVFITLTSLSSTQLSGNAIVDGNALMH
jgi:hypothetical protein